MIEAVHEVLLHDEHIGSIRRRGDFTKFAFDRDYWDRPDRRRARLSPAYDLVCTAVHLPDPGNPALGLPFLGATRLADVGRGHFARLRDRLRVGDEDVLDVVDETCERFHGLWADGAADRMPPPVAEWIGAHLEDTLNRLRGES